VKEERDQNLDDDARPIMSSSARLPVVPTVTVLAVMKSRLAGAIKGHSLLKKKADALTIR
jgi:V-type H+-transporting ATPase subunit D